MKKFTRINGNRWCSVDLELKEGRFSMSGSEGEIVTEKQARKMALEYWVSFFEESPAELYEMNRRHDKQFRSAKSAARYVLEIDGEYHGLDVEQEEDGKIYLVESCGQTREAIAEFFPELVCLFPYHLNDMHAGCQHQQALKTAGYGVKTGDVCRICQYSNGSAWLTNDLPADVVTYIENLSLEGE